MPIKRTRKLNTNRSTRELIVHEAERIVATDGLEGLRLDDIAETLGIKRPSLFTHFKGRDGILTAVAERAFMQLGTQFSDDEGDDVLATLVHGVEQLVDFMLDHPAYARLLARDFSTPGGLPSVNAVLGSKNQRTAPALLKPLFARLGRILARGYQRGVFEKISPHHFLISILGATMANLLQSPRENARLKERMVRLATGMVVLRTGTGR